MITLTRKALREWATAKPEGAILGVSGSHTSCPVAQYVTDNDGESPIVGARVRWYEAGRHHCRITPPALSKVINAVDTGVTPNKIVTREQFLEILGG